VGAEAAGVFLFLGSAGKHISQSEKANNPTLRSEISKLGGPFWFLLSSERLGTRRSLVSSSLNDTSLD
jgi:hypothetical protein